MLFSFEVIPPQPSHWFFLNALICCIIRPRSHRGQHKHSTSPQPSRPGWSKVSQRSDLAERSDAPVKALHQNEVASMHKGRFRVESNYGTFNLLRRKIIPPHISGTFKSNTIKSYKTQISLTCMKLWNFKHPHDIHMTKAHRGKDRSCGAEALNLRTKLSPWFSAFVTSPKSYRCQIYWNNAESLKDMFEGHYTTTYIW